jgi:hypothetical protein
MLRTKQIGTWTVSEVGALQGVRMNLYRAKTDEYVKHAGDVVGLSETLAEWAQLAACVDPYLSIDEYLEMPAVEIMEIVNAMTEVNEALPGISEPSKKKRK